MNRLSSIGKQLIILLSWSLFFTTLGVFSQTNQEAILLKEIKTLQGEDYYVKSNDLAELYLNSNPQQSIDLVGEFANSDDINDYPLEHARINYILGMANSKLGNYKNAFSNLEKSINQFKELNNESHKAKSILGIGVTLMSQGNYEEAKIKIEESISILEAESDESTLTIAYRELGKVYGYLDNHNKSFENLNKALEINLELNNKKEQSEDYYRIGINYYDRSDEDNALEFFTKAKALKEEVNDNAGLAKVSNSLGVLHSEKGNYQTSVNYHKQSIKAHQKIGDRQGEGISLNNLGIAYTDWGKLDSALVYHNKSLKLNQDINYTIGTIRSYANIGEVFQFKKDYPKARAFYYKAKTLSSKEERQPLMRLMYSKLGDIHLSENALDSSEYYLKKSEQLRLSQNNYFGLRGTYNSLSKLYEKKRDFSKALDYHKLYKTVQDSFASTRASEKLTEIQAKFDSAKQEKEITQLQQDNDRKTMWQNILGISTFLAIVLGIVVFQFFKYRNQKNKELLAIKETQHQKLAELDKTKTRFFNNISHEFRTPLTLILGPLSEIKESVDSARKPMVDMIERNSNRLLKLINQLLDLSKIESGNLQLKASYIDIVPELKKWINSFQSSAEMNNIKLNFKPESESCFIYTDIEKLEDIVINLLSNAIKYTPKKGIVSLSLNVENHNTKEHACITVSDTGKGIESQELERVFDRFYQASNANSENIIGTGIGLSLVKELTELHKGTVAVESKVGKGSTFKILLPLGKEHLSEDQIKLTSVQSNAVATVEESTSANIPLEAEETNDNIELPVVLIIEDNDDLRHFISNILKDNFTVNEAVNGEEGIEKAIELIPDIIISDVMMPKKDGFEVCNTLKNDLKTCHIPIILLTARSTKEDKLEGFKQLADAYLTKPFEKTELLARIDNLLKVRQKLQEHFGTGALLRPDKIELTSMDADFMEVIKQSVENEISNSSFGVVELAERVHLSRSQLFRKIKAITNLTPNEYIRSFRLHRAMDMLQQQSATVSEIAYEVGFQNLSYFSKCFHEQFGQPPSEFSK